MTAEAFDHGWKTAVEIRTRELGNIHNSVDRLKQYVANFAERPSTPWRCPLLNTAIDSDDGNPVLRARVTKALDG
jgi:TetR/AcrR family transcriptional regulator, transcriptional repressor for nem operon